MDLIFPRGDDLMTTSLTPICGWNQRKVTKNRVTEKRMWICGPKKFHMLCKILVVKLIAPYPLWDKMELNQVLFFSLDDILTDLVVSPNIKVI